MRHHLVARRSLQAARCASLPLPIFDDGRFSHPWPIARPPGQLPTQPGQVAWEALRLAFQDGGVPRADRARLDAELPVRPLPRREQWNGGAQSALRVAWLGHASLLLRMQGLNLLMDPVLSETVGSRIGPRRYRPAPCGVEDLPDIHAVLLSHNHYDHCDLPTLRRLEHHSTPLYLVPQGMAAWVQSSLQVAATRVVELSWWESVAVGEQVNVWLVPAQHWSRRGLWDLRSSLWGGFVVCGARSRFYFAGDTGFGPFFREIGQALGPFDCAALPIGAYHPRGLVGTSHMDPGEAATVHQLVQSRFSFGVHWGTFTLTTEPYLEPREALQRLRAEGKTGKYPFVTVDHGGVLEF